MKKPTFAQVGRAYKIYMEAIKVIANCPHQISPFDKDIREKLKKNRWACTSAYCTHCHKTFGWWCPVSVTGLCDYEQPDGRYDDDHCRYCGGPDERK